MDEKNLMVRIKDLVEEEHHLRAAVQSGRMESEEEQTRLRNVEEALDQCWDLLRRRRAAKENRQDPDTVETRPIPEVESYLQ